MDKVSKGVYLFVIPIIIMLIFIAVMVSGRFLKKPLGQKDNVPKFIDLAINDVKSEKWVKAHKDIQKLCAAYRMVLPRIQFSVERDDLIEMEMSLARLKGALMAKDRNAALIELSETHEHWDDIGT